MPYTGYGALKYHRRYRMDCCYQCGVELTNTNRIPSYIRNNVKQCRACLSKANAKKNPRHNPKNNPNRMWVNGKYISNKHPLHKPGRYKTFDDAAFQGTYKLDSIKEGYVYAITNPAWPEWVKIGMAIDADDRCNGYQTSSPFRDYKIEHVVVTNNRRDAEAEAHKAATKMAKETRGEWFKLDIELAKTILNNITIELKKGA